MFIIIVLAVLAVWGVAATIVELFRGGERPVPTDWARVALADDRPARATSRRSRHPARRARLSLRPGYPSPRP
jgi:hypothetical protein